MKPNFFKTVTVLLALGTTVRALAGPEDSLIDSLVQKGVLSHEEAAQIRDKSMEQQLDNTGASPTIGYSSAIKRLSLYGDVRLRAEMRDGKIGAGELNANTGTLYTSGGSQGRDRLRYAVTLGLNGELYDNFFFGVGVTTNPTGSSSVTFGDSGSSGPFGKAKGLIAINRVFLGWRPTDYLTLEVGQFDNPLYHTNLTWDNSFNPTGVAELFQKDVGNLSVFGTAGQFLYNATSFNDSSTTPGLNTSDVWRLEEQIGLKYKFAKDIEGKFAVGVATYTGTRSTTTDNNGETETGSYSTAPLVTTGDTYKSNDFAGPYTGGAADPFTNNYGVNNLMILDAPMELRFKLGKVPMKIYGDFAWNLSAQGRSNAAAAAVANGTAVTPSGSTVGGVSLPSTYTAAAATALLKSTDMQDLNRNNANQNMAYEIGIQAGELKDKGDWMGKVYWLDRQYYSLDPNLTDVDVFDGRLNMQGYVLQGGYDITKDLTATLIYGEASRSDNQLATPGTGQNLSINPVDHYRVIQADIDWKF